MKKWKKVSRDNPPLGVDFWGFNAFDDSVYVCRWDGENACDEGDPFPEIAEKGGNDYRITHWMEMEQIPEPPNVKDYEEDE